MIRVLFVCHGNICRSTMAQSIFTFLVKQRGWEDKYSADSAAVSAEELGNPIYPAAARKLMQKGIPAVPHEARQLCRADYDRFDLILGMDMSNMRGITSILGNDTEGKIARLLDGTVCPRDVADPWYTGDFETAFRDILEGCMALLAELEDTEED